MSRPLYVALSDLKRLIGIVIIGSFFWLNAFAATPLVTLPMVFAVDYTGAATLSIPISVPSGTNGMTPHISLSYSSSHANGPEGVGWTLSGFPAITRCPRTIATNNITAPVTFANGQTGSDVFCFIGEPLVQEQQQSQAGQDAPQGQQLAPGGQLIGLSGAYYGADQAVYTTEIEQLNRIVSYSATGYSGPSSFLVYMRNGLIYEFGANTNSQVPCGSVCPGTVVMTWMLDKVTDTFGNAIALTYQQNGGHAYPTQIDYTSNSGQSNGGTSLLPQNRVKFTYITRSDNPLQFFAGVQTQTNWLLNSIQTQFLSNGSYVAISNYALAYGPPGITGRSRLQSITESGLSGGKLLSATFGYCDSCNAPADLLTSFNNGLAGNTTIAYLLTTHTSVYPTGFVSGIAYPSQSLTTPRYVVQSVSAPNITGPNYTATSYNTTYKYYNGLTNLTGRGFLGFGSVCASDLQTTLQKCTYYNQSFPNIGNTNETKVNYPSSSCPPTNNCVLEDTVTTYGTFTPYDGRPAANTSYVSSITTTGSDLAGNPMPTTTKTFGSPNGPDAYGNVLNSTVDVHSVPGGSLTTDYTTNSAYTFGNDLAAWHVVPFGSAPVNWLIGRLEQSSVTASYTDSRSGSYSSTSGPRVTGYVPSPTNGSITTTTIQPTGTGIPNEQSGAGFTKVTNFLYDAFGNQKQAIESVPYDVLPAPPGTVLPSRETDTVWGSTQDPGAQYPDSVTNALHQTEIRVPDLRFMLLKSVTDINNQTTSYVYDDLGRKSSETLNDLSVITTTYFACPGSPVTAVLSSLSSCPAGAQYAIQTTDIGKDGTTTIAPTVTVYRDALDREIDTDTEAFDGSTSRVTKTYNTKLQLGSITRPYFLAANQQTTFYFYDALNRVTLTNYPDLSSDSLSYYETFKTIIAGTTSSFPGETTTKIFDGANNLLITIQYPLAGNSANSIYTNFVYDGFNNLNWITDNSNNATRYYYDSLGRKIGINDPDGGNRLQNFSAYGDLRAGGNGYDSFDYTQYDQLARPVWRCWTTPSSSVDQYTCANPVNNNEILETWTYDPTHGVGEAGGETSTQGTKSSSVLTYNALGQKLTSSYVIGSGSSAKTFSYTYHYDANNRALYYVSPSGSTPQTSYASTGYISGVTHHSGSRMWTVVSRDAELHLTAATFGASAPINATYSYSPTTGHETGMTTAPAGTQNYLENLIYGWDQLGNLVSRNDSVNNLQEVYCYDGLNRLEVVELATVCSYGAQVEVSFTYDLLGDMLTKSDVGTYTYPQAGQPQPHGVQSIAPIGGGNALTFSYDSVGKVSSDPLTQDNFTYLPFQLPATVSHAGGDTITMQYDADHNRVMRGTSTQKTTYYLPDGKAFQSSNGPIIGPITYDTYFIGDGERVADDSGLVGSLAYQYFLNDFQNSIGLVTNDSAATLQNIAYDVFGRPRKPNGTADPTWGAAAITPRGYINQEMLQDVQLIDLNARYYDPALAHFLSPDPVISDASDSQALNAYAYSQNNPASKTDPTGLAGDDSECNSGCWYWTSVATGGFNVGLSERSQIAANTFHLGPATDTNNLPKSAKPLPNGTYYDPSTGAWYVPTALHLQISTGPITIQAGIWYSSGPRYSGSQLAGAEESENEEGKGILGEIFEAANAIYSEQFYSTVSQIQQLDPNYSYVTQQGFTPGETDVEGARADLETTREKIAARIAGGHALGKHGYQFGYPSEATLTNIVRGVMTSPTYAITGLGEGRSAYYDRPTNTLVIVDPNHADYGTVFRPPTREEYLGTLR